MNSKILLGAFAASAFTAAASDNLSYRFDEVTKEVTKVEAAEPPRDARERRVAAGDSAKGGDLVRTGSGARAVLSVSERKARFEIGPFARARLQGDLPGVLLVLEKGRLKAFFDALTGEPPVERRVATPGALLAVRGTRYGVEISEGGETTLAVFEGTVEVIPSSFKSVFVRAGELCTFGPRKEPQPAPMRDRGMTESSWDRRGAGAAPPNTRAGEQSDRAESPPGGPQPGGPPSRDGGPPRNAPAPPAPAPGRPH
jgi:hypothetical protein